MTDTPLQQLAALGQSIWYDNIQRHLIGDGSLQTLIDRDAVKGLTSNPAIFEKAIAQSDEYDAQLAQCVARNPNADAQSLFNDLAISDIRGACDVFAPVHQASGGEDGFVSIEVSPRLAHDAPATVREAVDLHRRIARDNVMIKVPGTEAGVEAFRELTRLGVRVNVTLLFSVSRYRAIAAAYLDGLKARHDAGESLRGMTSVASFFVSRVDAAVDPLLQAQGAEDLCGKVAIANAKVAYGHYQNLFGPRFTTLREAGALPQRLLWASTGTKNPAYSKILYVEELIGAETVNTVPPATLDAYRDAGQPAARLGQGLPEAHALIEHIATMDINLADITARLEAEGLQQFVDAFARLLGAIDDKRQGLST